MVPKILTATILVLLILLGYLFFKPKEKEIQYVDKEVPALIDTNTWVLKATLMEKDLVIKELDKKLQKAVTKKDGVLIGTKVTGYVKNDSLGTLTPVGFNIVNNLDLKKRTLDVYIQSDNVDSLKYSSQFTIPEATLWETIKENKVGITIIFCLGLITGILI